MSGWTETGRAVVYPWHCDHLGHMNVQHYVGMFDIGAFHFLSMLGFGVARHARQGRHPCGCAAHHSLHQGAAGGEPRPNRERDHPHRHQVAQYPPPDDQHRDRRPRGDDRDRHGLLRPRDPEVDPRSPTSARKGCRPTSSTPTTSTEGTSLSLVRDAGSAPATAKRLTPGRFGGASLRLQCPI